MFLKKFGRGITWFNNTGLGFNKFKIIRIWPIQKYFKCHFWTGPFILMLGPGRAF